MPIRLTLSASAKTNSAPSCFDGCEPTADAPHMADLVERVAAGSAAAFGEIYDLTIDRVFRFAVHVTHDRLAAEELVCAAYVSAWGSAKHYEGSAGTVLDWLFVICADAALAAGLSDGSYRA